MRRPSVVSIVRMDAEGNYEVVLEGKPEEPTSMTNAQWRESIVFALFWLEHNGGGTFFVFH